MTAMGNLLRLALGVIPPVKISYSKFMGNVVSEVGVKIPTYSQPLEINGSVQRVKTDVYEALGLKMEKNYKAVFVPADIVGINYQQSPDKFSFYGKDWIVCGDLANWYQYDGWNVLLVVAERDYQ